MVIQSLVEAKDKKNSSKWAPCLMVIQSLVEAKDKKIPQNGLLYVLNKAEIHIFIHKYAAFIPVNKIFSVFSIFPLLFHYSQCSLLQIVSSINLDQLDLENEH